MSRATVAAPLALTALTLALLTALYPANVDFSLENPSWNGMSSLAELGAEPVNLAEAYALDPLKYAVLVIGPSKPFSEDEVRALKSFLARGGLVVVADDFGAGNQLLEALGVPARLSGRLLVDPLFFFNAPQLPLASWGGRRIALNYATVINATAGRVLAWSSPFSYLDLNLNGRRDEGEPAGPFPVAVELRVGPGTLIVVSDSSLFLNSMMGREANRDFLLAILGGRRPAVDVGHWEETPLTRAKALLGAAWRVARSPEVKYSLAALAVALSLSWGRGLARGGKRL